MTRTLILFAIAASAGTMAFAKDKDENLAPPKTYSDMVACRAIADPTERLACFDREVAAFEQAKVNEDVIITDRETVKQAKKEAFGFDRPELKILGKEGKTDVEEVEGVVSTISADRSGKLTIILESGARWQQIDTRAISTVKQGMKVRIRRGAMGSYFVNIDTKPAIKMRRIS
jgi:hypothetical protein